MVSGKWERLNKIMSNLMNKSGGRFTGCVITNERGLVVASKVSNGVSDETLAAMMSLLSETVHRVNENLGVGFPKTASIKSPGATVSLHEFDVLGKRFRIGAILGEEGMSRFSFFRRGMTLTRMQENMTNAAIKVRHVLEGR
jgi:predicted regulator of Ras-like GTPase activity (Roadblock/LC7/MglB family)